MTRIHKKSGSKLSSGSFFLLLFLEVGVLYLSMAHSDESSSETMYSSNTLLELSRALFALPFLSMSPRSCEGICGHLQFHFFSLPYHIFCIVDLFHKNSRSFLSLYLCKSNDLTWNHNDFRWNVIVPAHVIWYGESDFTIMIFVKSFNIDVFSFQSFFHFVV